MLFHDSQSSTAGYCGCSDAQQSAIHPHYHMDRTGCNCSLPLERMEYSQCIFYPSPALPLGPCFLMGQGRQPAPDSPHWSALPLQQHKPKKSSNHLLHLFRVNICPFCSFPEKEKSHDSVTTNPVRSGQIPCLLILLNIYFKSKYTTSLHFHKTWGLTHSWR